MITINMILKAMKFKHLIPILLLVFLGCEKAKIDEMPSNITKVGLIANLVDSLKIIIPENGNVSQNSPYLFSDTIQKNIVLIKESKVFVTFIDEGASYRNTLCWYSYYKSQPPLSVSDIKGNVLFPNISGKGEGGLLEPGYTAQVGTETFPAGTVIGFFLIANGWNDGNINYSNPTYYTNNNLNKGGEQWHVLFKNAYSHNIVIGFEDYAIGGDYNDVLFAVSDNNEGYEATSFDLSKVVVR